MTLGAGLSMRISVAERCRETSRFRNFFPTRCPGGVVSGCVRAERCGETCRPGGAERCDETCGTMSWNQTLSGAQETLPDQCKQSSKSGWIWGESANCTNGARHAPTGSPRAIKFGLSAGAITTGTKPYRKTVQRDSCAAVANHPTSEDSPVVGVDTKTYASKSRPERYCLTARARVRLGEFAGTLLTVRVTVRVSTKPANHRCPHPRARREPGIRVCMGSWGLDLPN